MLAVVVEEVKMLLALLLLAALVAQVVVVKAVYLIHPLSNVTHLLVRQTQAVVVELVQEQTEAKILVLLVEVV
jgi:hypothetical protein